MRSATITVSAKHVQDERHIPIGQAGNHAAHCRIGIPRARTRGRRTREAGMRGAAPGIRAPAGAVTETESRFDAGFDVLAPRPRTTVR